MAHTKVTKTGTQNTGTANTFSYSGSFNVFKASEVEVELDNVKLTFTTSTIDESASPREYTVDYTAKTIHIGGANLAGTNSVTIQPVTDMGDPTPRATYSPGSSVTSDDLNNNQLQLMRKAMEYDEQKLSSRGGTMTGNLHFAKDIDITFEGDTDNAYETTLTVADPTSDKTITLPDTTGTVVTTGDTATVTATMLAANSVDSSELVDGSIDTSHIGNSQVTTDKIAADAVTGAKIADDAINSEHYTDGSIDTAHIADSQVTTAKIADTAVTTAKITDGNVTTAKIAADAITAAKIADDVVNSEHYAAGSIDTEHIADSQITTAKIAADAVTNAKIADDQIDSEHYVDGSIDTAHIGDNQVTTAKIADANITTAKLATDAVTTAKIADAQVTTAKIALDAITSALIPDDTINSEHYVADSIDTEHYAAGSVDTAALGADAVTGAKIADDAVDSEHIAADSLDTEHYAAASVDTTALGSNAVTTGKITDSNVTTAKIADSNVTLAKLASDLKQTSISNSDTQLPTSGAVVDYVAAQIAPLGGLEVIADEDNFPTSQPASGVVISISDAAGIVVNGSGVSTTARTAGNGSDNVTINNFPSSLYNETLASGVGLMVSSTGSSQTYNYHKILAAETDVKQLSDDINDFNARYRVGSSNPTSALDSGDLFFNTGTGKLLVYNGTNSAWEEAQSIGNYYINTISSYSGTGGNSASFNGSAYRFVLSNAGTTAEQHIVSVNGVIQKPNSGTSQPGEGFAIDGSSIIFSSAPATGADYFIITIGSTVNIGTPSDGTVTAAKIASGAVTTVKIADAAVTTAKIADAAVTTAKIAKPIDLADNEKIRLGTGNDLELYHNGTNSYIDNNTGDLYLRNNVSSDVNADIYIQAKSGENSVVCYDDGPVELYYDNTRVFETDASSVKLRDDIKAKFGTGDDIQIYHDATNSHIHNATGEFRVRSNDLRLMNAAGNEHYLVGSANGAVNLYYDNVKTFETVNSGIKVLGPEGGSSFIYMYADEGDDNADQYILKVEQDGTGFYIRNNVSGSTETNLRALGNGAVELYYDNVKRFETTNAGAATTGSLGVGAITTPTHSYNQGVHVHAAGSGAVVHLTDTNSGSGADKGFDILSIGAAYLWQRENANMIFGTNATSRWNIYGSNGHFVPSANNTYDIGDTSNRVRNIYTNDLHLSNEGHSNDVDGSWGDWTIQEGESDLFLKNNRSGKKYKFNLTEVS